MYFLSKLINFYSKFFLRLLNNQLRIFILHELIFFLNEMIFFLNDLFEKENNIDSILF